MDVYSFIMKRSISAAFCEMDETPEAEDEMLSLDTGEGIDHEETADCMLSEMGDIH